MTRSFERPIQIEELLVHSGWLRSLATSLVSDPAHADDLVQETWIAALRHPPAEGVPPRPWLARVFRNRARNASRDARVRAEHEPRSSEERSPRTPDAIAQEVELQRMLAEAVGRLSEPGRTIVVLRYFRGLDSRAIGRELALPDGTVRWKLKQALDELRLELDRRFDGGRSAWSALLAPFAFERTLAAATGGAAFGPPVVLVAASLALAGGLGALLWHRSDSAGPAARDDERGASALVRAEDSSSGGGPSIQPTESPARSSLAPETRARTAPAGASTGVLRGHVLLDGRTPDAPIELELRLGARAALRYATTDAAGRFSFSGLDEGWSGTLQAPGYEVEGEFAGPHVDARVSARELELRLKGHPFLSGRFLDPVAVRPVATPALDIAYTGFYELRSVDSDRLSAGGVFRTDADGRFRLGLTHGMQDDELVRCDLLVEEYDLGRKVVHVGPFRPSERRDLGDVVLDPGRAVPFRIVDESGQPIPAALARADDWNICAQVGEDGKGTLLCVPLDGAPFHFAAQRYADRVLVVRPGDAPEVVLERTSSLLVHVRGKEGAKLPALRVRVSDPDKLFVDTSEVWPNFLPANSSLSTSASGNLSVSGMGIQRDGSHDAPELVVDLDSSGELLLRDMTPGFVFTIEVQTQSGRTLAVQTAALGEREWQDLDVVVEP